MKRTPIHFSSPHGFTLIEIVIAIMVGAAVTVGSFTLYKAQRLQADIDVTKNNAFKLLEAGKTYYSINRTFPTSVDTLVSQGLLGNSVTPNNPLGGAFSILGANLSVDVGHVIVRATITRGGTPAEMVKPLDANSTYSTDSVEWRRLTSDYSSGTSANQERFKAAYGGGSTLEISSSLANYNIYTMLGSPSSPVNVTLTIPSGVTVSSNSAATAALDACSLPSGSTVTIVNNGYIIGAGGRGGDGGLNFAGSSGNSGGVAINSCVPITIDNTNGYIFGGGGGGGGGGGHPWCYSSGGGGGGAGTVGGSGGTGPCALARHGQPGGNTGGVGGIGEVTSGCAGNGGNGGEYGETGLNGTNGCSGASGGPGGPAGKAISLNGNSITWTGGNDVTRVKGAVN